MSTTSQRRIKPIQDHIDSGNWKQALQLCEKYQKKGEKSEAFLTTRALVLAKQPEEAQQKQGRDALLQLCKQSPPITDEETIFLLDNALANLGLEENNSLALWERAASAKSGDEGLLEKWVSRAITDQNWVSAQKAAMMLRKSFAKERQYEFWVIFMCYRINKDLKNDEKIRTLFGTMAYKMLEKAASQTPVAVENNAEISPGKAIHTSEELYLLISVYTQLGYFKEALQVLQSDSLGIHSRMASQDPPLFRELLFVVLQKSKSYDETARLCRLLLGLEKDEAQNVTTLARNPYEEHLPTWETLVEATMECTQTGSAARLQSLLEAYRSEHPRSRYVAIAYLDLLCRRQGVGQDIGPDVLLEACKEVYTVNYDKQICTKDIGRAIGFLNDEDQENFDDFIIQYSDDRTIDDSDLMRSFVSSNRVELDYAFRASPSSDPDILQDVIHQSFSHYEIWWKKGEEPTFAQIMIMMTAIASLVRLNDLARPVEDQQRKDNYTHISIHLIHAQLIGRFLIYLAPLNHLVSLIYIRLSQLIGASTIVLRRSQDLSLKNLQWETFGHTILTRLSTIHPHDAFGSRDPNETYMSPALALRSALTLYQRADDSRTDCIVQGLHSQSYRSTDRTIDFGNKMRNSICRKIYYIESQRVKRLVGTGQIHYRHFPNPTLDNRNFDSFPNNEPPDSPTMEERLRYGPLPQATWIQVMLACDLVHQLLTEGPNGTLVSEVDRTLKIAADLAEAEGIRVDHSPEFTAAESDACSIQLDLGLRAVMMVLRLQMSSKSKEETEKIKLLFGGAIEKQDIRAIITPLQKMVDDGPKSRSSTLIKLGENLEAPGWEYFHESYMTLDTLKFVMDFLAFADAVQKIPATSSKAKGAGKKPPLVVDLEQKKKTKELVLKIEENVKEHAKESKLRLEKQGVLGELLDAVLIKEKGGASGGSGTGEKVDMHKWIAGDLEGLIGMAGLEEGVAELRDSWVEGLERIGGVRVGR